MFVLIPSYQPDERLVTLVGELRQTEGLGVLVVDDGSGPDYAGVFAAARAAGAELVSYPTNRGKGFALRAGFSYLADHHPGEAVVCADSDGQHTILDILRVAAALVPGVDMVLGVRQFTGRVPLRSRVGNTITAKIFAMVTRTKVTDTQTGLRAYPAALLPWLGQVEGDRFEYELQLLLQAARERLTIVQVPIATIYLDRNSSSHFRPLQDSARIYRPLLGFAASSLLAAGLDAALLLVLAMAVSLPLAVIGARLVSATVNFTVNRRLVFGSRAPLWGELRRYAGLAVTLLAANLLLIQVLTAVLGSLVVAKILTEATLFAASFAVQRLLVFVRPKPATAPLPAREPVAAAS